MLRKERIPRSRDEAARRIDYTVLRPTATIAEIVRGAEEAGRLGFRCVVVPPHAVKAVGERVRIPVATVVAFPMGFSSLKVKLEEVRRAAEDGAKEVDVVLNISAIREGAWGYVREEVSGVVAIARELGLVTKFIVETGYLTREEVVKASRMVADAGGDYVKTCTGFGPRGVTVDDVVTIRGAVGDRVGIKASGGIRTAVQAVILWAFGADILGTSSAKEIYEEYEQALKELGLLSL